MHGKSLCRRCSGALVRDMYGVWYHDGSQEGIEKFNDDDHAPEPQHADLIAIKRAEHWAMVAAERKRIIDAVREETDGFGDVSAAAVLAIVRGDTHPFDRGGGCMSRCRCGKSFSDPVHGSQPENIRRIREAITTAQLDWMDQHGRK